MACNTCPYLVLGAAWRRSSTSGSQRERQVAVRRITGGGVCIER